MFLFTTRIFRGTDFKNLEEGQEVEFEIGEGRKGDEALDVRVV